MLNVIIVSINIIFNTNVIFNINIIVNIFNVIVNSIPRDSVSLVTNYTVGKFCEDSEAIPVWS